MKSSKKFEARFAGKREMLESSREKIKEFLEQKTLGERDRVRLTRVLQLVDRYKPEREIQESRVDQWKKYLESVFRFLPSREKTQQPLDLEKMSAQSYLLAEKTIASLRDLRRIDSIIEKETNFSEEWILHQERSGSVERKEVLDTSLTLEYEKRNWGVERICLDGIQNHLPSDSKGEHVWVQCLVDGEWVTLDEAKRWKGGIKAVRFVDDGVGFDVKNLTLLYSTKTEEEESSGQFGEGIKMMAAAALREGLEPEMESQTWRAKPIPKKVNLYDTRNEKKQDVQQLSFRVDHLSGESMIGSRTTFHRPTENFVNELLQIEDKVLALRENCRPVFVGSTGDIVNYESGGLFVKGVYVTEKNTLFSYNLKDVETNRDRNAVVSEGVEQKIAQIMKEISDKKIIKTMLQKSILEPEAIESFYYSHLEAEHPSVWIEGFYDAFGEDAVLDTNFEIPGFFKDKTINKITLPICMTSILRNAGVKTDKEVTPEFWDEVIPTSLTLEYGKDMWDEERILLDAVQNHLPNDSGGSYVGLRFKTKDGQWYSFSKLSDIPDEQIEELKIYDDGTGYDSRLLGFFHSTKDDSSGAGKFGEGLKMLCVASLRKGVGVTLQSNNWSAKPRALRQEVDGRKIDQLVFDVTHATKEQKIDNDNDVYQSSSTTFSNITPELLREFREINKKVLTVEKPKPIVRIQGGELLSLEGGLMYVRELLIPGDHDLVFTYHFSDMEIKNRDRSFVGREEIAPLVAEIWSEVQSPEAIKSFLFKANFHVRDCNDEKDFVEFSTDFTPDNPDLWIDAFFEMFGRNATIRDVRSEDFNAVHENLHVGLETISFPSAVFRTLRHIGLPTNLSRKAEMFDVKYVPEEELTAEEKVMLKDLTAIDAYLPNNRSSEIKVYIYDEEHAGQAEAGGFSDGVYIHLNRDILTDFTRAADVYIHEKTHHNTGAADASARFRNYLTFALTKLTLDQLKEARPDLLKEGG